MTRAGGRDRRARRAPARVERSPRARARGSASPTSTPARCTAPSACSAHERGIALDDDAALAALDRRARASTLVADGGTRILRRRARPTDGDPRGRTPASSPRACRRARWCASAWSRCSAQLGAAGGVVMEGRDIGTVVFPGRGREALSHADPASARRRRAGELRARGRAGGRGARSRARSRSATAATPSRAHSPLRPAADAVRARHHRRSPGGGGGRAVGRGPGADRAGRT